MATRSAEILDQIRRKWDYVVTDVTQEPFWELADKIAEEFNLAFKDKGALYELCYVDGEAAIVPAKKEDQLHARYIAFVLMTRNILAKLGIQKDSGIANWRRGFAAVATLAEGVGVAVMALINGGYNDTKLSTLEETLNNMTQHPRQNEMLRAVINNPANIKIAAEQSNELCDIEITKVMMTQVVLDADAGDVQNNQAAVEFEAYRTNLTLGKRLVAHCKKRHAKRHGIDHLPAKKL